MDASMDVILFAWYSNADGNFFQLNARWFICPFARIVSCQTTNHGKVGCVRKRIFSFHFDVSFKCSNRFHRRSVDGQLLLHWGLFPFHVSLIFQLNSHFCNLINVNKLQGCGFWLLKRFPCKPKQNNNFSVVPTRAISHSPGAMTQKFFFETLSLITFCSIVADWPLKYWLLIQTLTIKSQRRYSNRTRARR